MKSNSATLLRAEQRSRAMSELIHEWLKSRNRFASSIMEEQVTNLQMVHIVHCAMAMFTTLGMAASSPVLTLVAVAWLAMAMKLAKEKGSIS